MFCLYPMPSSCCLCAAGVNAEQRMLKTLMKRLELLRLGFILLEIWPLEGIKVCLASAVTFQVYTSSACCTQTCFGRPVMLQLRWHS